MDGDDVALGIEAALEGHEGRPLLEMGRVELEGDLHNALGRLGGELGGGGHGVAAGVDQRLAGRLVDERTVCGVGFARDEALVLHGVDELDLAAGDDLVAVFGVGELRAYLDDGDGLPLVGKVLVCCELHAGGEELLEHHDALTAQAGAVEGELHRLDAIGFVGGERCGSGNLLAIDGHGIAGLGIHQRGLERVLDAGGQPLVCDLVDDGDFGTGDEFVAVRFVGRRGADAHEANGLPLIVDVGMGRHLHAARRQGFEGHDVLARQQAPVEGELKLHLAGALLGPEGLARGHGVAVDADERLAGGLEHKGARDGVFGAVGLEVLVIHGV